MNGGQSINGGVGREWRFLGRLLLESVATGAFVSLVLGLAVFIVATQARAAPLPASVQQGTLVLRDGESSVTAPLAMGEIFVRACKPGYESGLVVPGGR